MARGRARARDSKALARSSDWRLVCSRKFLSGNTFWMAFRIFMKMTGFARQAEPRIKESPPQTENINVSHVVGGAAREKNDRDVEVLCRGGRRERNREMTKRSNLYASE